MAYSFTRSSSQYLSTNAVSQGVPMTFSAWIYVTSLPATLCIMAIGDESSTHRNRLTLSSTGVVSASSTGLNTSGGTSSGISNTAFIGTVSPGQWYHIAATFEASKRVAYFNGIAASPNLSTLQSFNTFTYTYIGAQYSSSVIDYFDGQIADVGIWNAALTADDIASLSKGFSCNNIYPQSLVFYAPLIRDLVDVRRGLTITNNNSATIIDHLRINL